MWRNWAGNETARPRRVATPRSAAEVAQEIRRAAADGLTVRMTGTGHSFTPAAATDGVRLLPGGLTGIRSVDAAAGLVTVEAILLPYKARRRKEDAGPCWRFGPVEKSGATMR